MERDRNLLFGVLAVQLGKVTPAQLMDVAAAWATAPSRDLAQRLVETGALSAKDCELITGFADHAVAIGMRFALVAHFEHRFGDRRRHELGIPAVATGGSRRRCSRRDCRSTSR